MKWALDWDYKELAEQVAALGEPSYRAGQICEWVYKRKVFDFADMTNLSLGLRDRLSGAWSVSLPRIVSKERSKHDGTSKILWALRDENTVESVMLRHKERMTACISTQVGCPLACAFCTTGQSGFVRNLSAGEIVSQFLGMELLFSPDRTIQNLVTMGMGEPLLNADNLLKAIEIINNPKMRGLGARHIVVSTVGIVPGILKLANFVEHGGVGDGISVKLAVSIHAPTDELRDELMPVNVQYPLAELKKALIKYQDITKDRIGIQYSLFDGINDSSSCARALADYLSGLGVYVNLIPANISLNENYTKPPAYRIEQFKQILELNGIEVAQRSEHGQDISAACGQLRQKASNEKSEKNQNSPKNQKYIKNIKNIKNQKSKKY